jgi:hypothetical protein
MYGPAEGRGIRRRGDGGRELRCFIPEPRMAFVPNTKAAMTVFSGLDMKRTGATSSLTRALCGRFAATSVTEGENGPPYRQARS